MAFGEFIAQRCLNSTFAIQLHATDVALLTDCQRYKKTKQNTVNRLPEFIRVREI